MKFENHIDFIEAPSPNFDARPTGVLPHILVLHYTGMKTGQEALERLQSLEARVSSHYLVEEDGRIFKLVDEANRAWHAGVSHWRGQAGLNDCSIGIEIVNPGHEWGYRPFPEQQMQALIALSKDIVLRHKILPHNVVGHSDIAFMRKSDPGELFNWRGLSDAGVGLFWQAQDIARFKHCEAVLPNAPKEQIMKLQEKLVALGYDLPRNGTYDSATQECVSAFQRHWRGANISGLGDKETMMILAALLAKIKAD